MERLTSRKNELIRHIRRLGADRAYRRETGEFVCDGEKLLGEAVRHGAEITAVLWSGAPAAAGDGGEIPCAAQFVVPGELLDYVSPLKSAAGVVFTARIRRFGEKPEDAPPGRTLVLETIQDPGNLGTILRTANALRIDTVILTGDFADPYGPKAVRAGMGAVFRQRFFALEREALRAYLTAHGLRLYGAALSPAAADVRALDLRGAAVAVGSEGRGLSPELRAKCDGELIIPMNAECESLNAAVAAAIIMWELSR